MQGQRAHFQNSPQEQHKRLQAGVQFCAYLLKVHGNFRTYIMDWNFAIDEKVSVLFHQRVMMGKVFGEGFSPDRRYDRCAPGSAFRMTAEKYPSS